MPKVADIGGKRLISLAPDAWAQWVTQRNDVVAREVVTSEFQWISRASDVLMRCFSPEQGEFLQLTELQIRYKPGLRRMRAYAGLAEETFHLPVFPVLINILPSKQGVEAPERYESEFMGLHARQDYRVINLWTVDVNLVLQRPLPALLPFTPVLRDGAQPQVVIRALDMLRQDEKLSDLEPLLAFFASFVLDIPVVQQIMRWDMNVLRESPWYQEILEQGLVEGMEKGMLKGMQQGMLKGMQQGMQQGALRQLLRLVRVRFQIAPPSIQIRLQQLNADQLEQLVDVALAAESLDEFMLQVPASPDNGKH
ncbi:Rpn family recombination-promoting nuclease/putative transposase [Candidatus Amarolinea dominans]|nr:Rpn family recombination-promoting nuclease/putative transposase [Anaerolineae bacterium]